MNGNTLEQDRRHAKQDRRLSENKIGRKKPINSGPESEPRYDRRHLIKVDRVANQIRVDFC